MPSVDLLVMRVLSDNAVGCCVWRCVRKPQETPVVNDVTGRYQSNFVLTRGKYEV